MKISISMSEDDIVVNVAIDVPLPDREEIVIHDGNGIPVQGQSNESARREVARAMGENAVQAGMIAMFGPAGQR